MRDFNTKVGDKNEVYERIMGKHGMGTKNINGEPFLELCLEHDLVIGGTIFPNKDIHKITWVSPDLQTQNQIAISKKWRGSLINVRNRRGADVRTDHHLLVAELRIKLLRHYNLEKLKDTDIREKWSSKWEQLNLNVIENINVRWDHLVESTHKITEELLGYREEKRKEWLWDNTWSLIQ